MAATGTILYGGAGGKGDGSSANDGSVVILDQSTAAVTVVGHPVGVARMSGLTFDATGALYGATVTAGSPPITSTLIRVDPDTGALLQLVGPITDGPGGPAIAISDIATQSGTDVLYGVRPPIDRLNGASNLYTIDKTTAVATLVGSTPGRLASIAFAPDGTLYESATVPGPPTLYTLNPANGAALTSVPTVDFYASLGVRPTDGVLFGGNGDEGEIFTIDPTTGAAALVGDTTPTLLGDLSFRSCAITFTGVASDPSSLWPPNLQLVNVAINYTATDSCDGAAGAVTCSLSVASNEGTSADWAVVDAHDVQLRAERDGNGSGRLYTVTISCSDSVGSTGSTTVTVSVPHDQGH